MSNLELIGAAIIVSMFLIVLLSTQIFMQDNNINYMLENTAFSNSTIYRRILKSNLSLIGYKTSDKIITAENDKISFNAVFPNIGTVDENKIVEIYFEKNQKGNEIKRKIMENGTILEDKSMGFKEINDIIFTYYNKEGAELPSSNGKVTEPKKIAAMSFLLGITYKKEAENKKDVIWVEERFLLKNLDINPQFPENLN